MISFKYLVAFLSLLVVAGAPGWAATDDTETPSASTEAGSTDGATHKTHHKRHHKATKTTAEATAPAGTTTAAAPSASAPAETTTSASTPKKSGSSPQEKAPSPTVTSFTSAKTAPNATAGATAAPATPAATTAGSTHHSRHHHGTTNVAAGTNAAPAGGAEAPAAAKASTATSNSPANSTATAKTASAGTSGTPSLTQTATTTTGKPHRHHHGKATPLPQPPIVANPAASPISPQQPTVTLPTSPPFSESRPPAPTPIIQTGLPVARPGAGTTATLPISPIRTPAANIALYNFPFHDFPIQRRHTQIYPWKSNIITTVFWIGEGSTPLSGATNHASAWDIEWEHHNGGADSGDIYDMSGYASSEHASTLNPFYVALPFNDLAYPDKTARWLPGNWERPQRRGEKPVSACQHRWVEIKNTRNGRVCFAQWEDVGPIVTDDAEYVFGGERPSASRGLDVSPAVQKYLGLGDTAITSWRFVDDDDVQPGMWLRYDEQALLFRAIKEMKGSQAQRIQDLEQPVPDPSDDSSSQRKTGAARG